MSSRSPVPGVGYDQSLLAAAPEVTKADKQEGYNPDLLEQGTPTRAPTSRRTPVSLPVNGNHNGSDESNGLRKAGLPSAVPPTTTTSPGKARPKKLMWIIGGVVLIVVIAIAVGVGVGVGSKKGSGNGTIGAGGQVGSNPTEPIKPTATTGETSADGVNTGDVKPTGGATSASGIDTGANGGAITRSTAEGDSTPIPRGTFLI